MTELGINWGVGPHFSYRWASPASPSCGRLGSPATGGRRRATREPIEGCPASPSHRTGPGRLPGSSGPRWGRCRCGAGPACWCGCVPAHTPARVLRWMVASLAAPGPCWLVGSPGVSRLPFVDRARSKGLPQDRERSPRQTLRPAASDGLPAIGGRLDAFNDWASRAEAVTLGRLRNAGWFVSGMPLSGLDDAGGHEVGELRRCAPTPQRERAGPRSGANGVRGPAGRSGAIPFPTRVSWRKTQGPVSRGGTGTPTPWPHSGGDRLGKMPPRRRQRRAPPCLSHGTESVSGPSLPTRRSSAPREAWSP